MTFYNRAGAAFGAGTTIGAAFGIASVADNDVDARGAGAVLSTRPQLGAAPEASAWARNTGALPTDPTLRSAEIARRQRARERVQTDGLSTVLDPVVHWLDRYVYTPVTDYYESALRFGSDNVAAADNPLESVGASLGALGAVLPGAGMLSEDFRENYWNPARAASMEGKGASIAQAAWLGAGGHGRWNEKTGRNDIPLIDDPELWAERQNYFAKGPQKWVTGVADATLALALDPTIIAGAGVGATARAARAVSATDVVAASSGGRGARLAANVSDTATNAADDVLQETVAETFKPNRFRSNVEKLTDYAYNKFGEVREGKSKGFGLRADLLNDPVLGRTAEKGAIADTMGWVASTFTDEATAKGVMDDVIYAAAGDRGALDRLGGVSERLRLDVEALAGPDLNAAREAVRANPYLPQAEKWKAFNDDDLFKRQATVIADDIKTFQQQVSRVQSAGTAGLGRQAVDPTLKAPANFQEIPLTAGLRRRAQVSKVFHSFRSLPPVQFLSGTHIPNTLSLTDDAAVEIFDQYAQRSVRALGPGVKASSNSGIAQLRDRFAVAHSELDPGLARSQRGAVVDQFNRVMQKELTNRLAREKGWDMREVDEWITSARTTWQTEVEQMSERVRQAAPGDVPVWRDSDGNVFAADRELSKAVSTAQFQQQVPLTDWNKMDRLLRKHFKPGMVAKGTGGEVVRDASVTFLETWNDLWKFGALFRLAYPLRVQMDTQARNIATMGVARYGLMAATGGKNFAVNNLSRVNRDAAELYSRKFGAHMELEQTRERLAPHLDADGKLIGGGTREARRLKATADRLESITNMSLEEWRAAGARFTGIVRGGEGKALSAQRAQLRRDLNRSDLTDEKRAALTSKLAGLDAQASALNTESKQLWETLGRPRKLTDLGTGQKVRRGKTDLKKVQGSSAKMDTRTGEFTPPDLLNDAYLGARDLERHLYGDARASVMGQFVSAQNALENRLRRESTEQWRSVGFGTSEATRSQWRDAYVEQVNRYVRNDASLMRMAAGADDGTIVDWLRTDPDGQAYWKAFAFDRKGKPKFEDEWDLVSTQRYHFDLLVPKARAADTVLAREVTPADVDSWFDEGDVRPQVPMNITEAVALDGRQATLARVKSFRDGYFNLASVMPETMMGRHPQYQRFFQTHMDRLAASTGKDDFTLEQVRQLRKRADNAARRDMGRIMFDTSHPSNLGHHMRFIAPFYSAWADTMSKWARIFAEQPHMAPAMFRTFEGTASMAVVVDDDGNRIMPNGEVYRLNEDGSLAEKVGETSNPSEGTIVWAMPQWVTDLTGSEEVRLSRGSLNAIFQGETPFLPGLGPIVTIPVNEALRGSLPFTSEVGPALADKVNVDIPGVGTVDLMTWVQPFGQTDQTVLEQNMPSWMGNLVEGIRADSPRFTQVYTQLMEEQVNAEALGLSDPMSSEERRKKVMNKARNWWFLRFLGSQVPVSTTPRSRLDWYFQEYRRYQQEHGPDASDKFIADYPDYAEATISASMNNTGIQATIEAWDAAQPWRTEIAANPSIGRGLLGPANYSGEFSDATYTAQMTQKIDSTVSNQRFRQKRDIQDVDRELLVQRGWREWTKATEAVSVKLEEMGLSSIQSKGAEGIRAWRDEYLKYMMSENPVWGQEYNKGAENGANPVAPWLDGMATAMAHKPKLVADSQHLEFLQQYFAGREVVRQKMLAAGFRSTGESDDSEFRQTDLYATWLAFIEDLRRKSPAFSDMYANEGLERDNLASPVVVDAPGGGE